MVIYKSNILDTKPCREPSAEMSDGRPGMCTAMDLESIVVYNQDCVDNNNRNISIELPKQACLSQLTTMTELKK